MEDRLQVGSGIEGLGELQGWVWVWGEVPWARAAGWCRQGGDGN